MCIYVFILLLLSVLTKETGFLFLLILLFYRIYFVKRDLRKFVIGGLSVIIVYLVFRWGIGQADSPIITIIPISQLTLIERLVNVPAIIFYYLKTFFFPVTLVIDQQWVIKSLSFSTFYLPLIIDCFFLTLLGFLIHKVIKDNKKFLAILLFSFWLIIGVGMHLQIITLSMTVADRWFYFPLVGLLGVLGIGIQIINTKLHHKKNLYKFLYLIGIFLLITLSIRTIIRNKDWSNNISLYTHDTKVYANYELELNLGNAYFQKGDITSAINHIEKSIQIYPNELNLNNLGAIYEKTGRTEEAEKSYNKALTASKFPPAGNKLIRSWSFHGLVWTLLISNKFDKANEIIRLALQEYPESGQLWSDLAICEYKLGNKANALQALKKAEMYSNYQDINTIYTIILTDQPMTLSP